MKRSLLAAAFASIAAPAAAFCGESASGYVGWTIIYSGKVTGYIDDGVEKDDFEGCDYDRILIIGDSKQIVCAGYGYAYAYRPDIFVISDGSSMRACIKDKFYRVRR